MATPLTAKYARFGAVDPEDPILAMIDDAAKRYGVDRNLAHTVVNMESGYNPKARSPKGAAGLGQLMPGTARDLGVQDRYDPAQNIDGSVKYLSQLSKQFGGDTQKILAAYNAGPGRVAQYGGVPPFPETQNYVAKGTGLLAQAQPQEDLIAKYAGLGAVEPAQAAAPPEAPPPAAPPLPKALQPGTPGPAGFGQRVYQQTLQQPVELAKGLRADPIGTLMQTGAHLFGITQYANILKQVSAGQYLPAAISILSFQNPAQMQAEAMTKPLIEDVRTGNWRGATGDVVGGGLALFGAEALPKVPRIVRATPEVVGAGLRGGASAAYSPRTLGELGISGIVTQVAGPKAGAAVQTAMTGTRVALGAAKEIRKTLNARAVAAAQKLAEEAAAAQAAPRVQPVRAGALLALPEPAIPMPPAADTSFVRAVPGEYAVPEALPPSRQLPAPGRSPIITPEPEAPPDASFVRPVPAEYPEVLSQTLRKNPAAATAAEQLRDELIRNGTVSAEDATPVTRKSGAQKITEARNAKAERYVESFKRFEFSAADAQQFGPSEWEAFAKAIGEEVPGPETIDRILFRMRKRK